jgi:Ig-like domain from next to BRCA1 gene
VRRGVLGLIFLVVFFGCGDDHSSPELPLAGFKVEFVKHDIPTTMKPGQTVSADVTIKNASSRTWPSETDSKRQHAVNLSYHWLDRKRQMVVYDGLRTPLPRDLNPGESVTLKATIRAPEKPGEYLLHLTLVQEGVAWFSENDGGHLLIAILVR